MSKNILMKKRMGGTWESLFPATVAKNVAMSNGKTVESQMGQQEQAISQLQGKANITTYTSLSQLGLKVGNETIESIINAMAENSMAIIPTNPNFNAEQYPLKGSSGGSVYATLIVHKNAGKYACLVEFIEDHDNKRWQGVYHYADYYKFTGWSRVMTEKNVSNPNLLINGDFQIWQEGTVFERTPSIYTADMWYYDNYGKGAAYNGRIEKINDGFKLTQLDTTSMNHRIMHKQETIKNMVGKTSTISIKYKTNKPFSVTALGRSKTCVSDGNVNKIVITGKYNGNTENVLFQLYNNVDSGMYLELYEVKLEMGEVATPLVSRLYGEELELCQRYYERIDNLIIPLSRKGLQAVGLFRFKPKRIPPSIIFYNGDTVNKVRAFDNSGGNHIVEIGGYVVGMGYEHCHMITGSSKDTCVESTLVKIDARF